RQFEDLPVRVVDIDEASLQEFGQWPWPRDRLAKLVDQLSDLGAAAIAFDVIFSEPDRLSPRQVILSLPGIDPALASRLPDNDQVFAESIVERPVALGFGLTNRGGYLPPVKAGFAYTGEDPAGAAPSIESATPLLPQLAANATGIGHVSLNPGSS